MTAHAGTALLAAGLVGSVVFIAGYTVRAPWWRSEAGWHLITFPAALGLLEANGLVFRWLGDYPGRQTVNLLIFAAAVGATWWRVALMIRATRIDRRPDS